MCDFPVQGVAIACSVLRTSPSTQTVILPTCLGGGKRPVFTPRHIVTEEHENKADTTEILIRALSGRLGISLSVSSIRVFFGVIEKSFGDTPTLA